MATLETVPQPTDERCSFCEILPRDVLIRSPDKSAYICAECVVACVGLVIGDLRLKADREKWAGRAAMIRDMYP